MNRTRKKVQHIADKESFLTQYRAIKRRRDEAAATSVRLTNVLKHMYQGGLDRGWEFTDEDLG